MIACRVVRTGAACCRQLSCIGSTIMSPRLGKTNHSHILCITSCDSEHVWALNEPCRCQASLASAVCNCLSRAQPEGHSAKATLAPLIIFDSASFGGLAAAIRAVLLHRVAF